MWIWTCSRFTLYRSTFYIKKTVPTFIERENILKFFSFWNIAAGQCHATLRPSRFQNKFLNIFLSVWQYHMLRFLASTSSQHPLIKWDCNAFTDSMRASSALHGLCTLIFQCESRHFHMGESRKTFYNKMETQGWFMRFQIWTLLPFVPLLENIFSIW